MPVHILKLFQILEVNCWLAGLELASRLGHSIESGWLAAGTLAPGGARKAAPVGNAAWLQRRCFALKLNLYVSKPFFSSEEDPEEGS